MLIEGLVGLMLAYHDYHSTLTLYPLLPWLHSTEPCEHTFGCACQIVRDFALMDFYSMIRKVQYKVREAVALGEASNPKATASGYNHTYVLSNGINLAALATHFSNDDIPTLTSTAMQEAESLVSLLGISPASLQVDTPPLVQLPSITSWYDDEWFDDDIPDPADDLDPFGLLASQELQDILRNPELATWASKLTIHQRERLQNLVNAATALSLDNMLTVYVTLLFQNPIYFLISF